VIVHVTDEAKLPWAAQTLVMVKLTSPVLFAESAVLGASVQVFDIDRTTTSP
jgi:hypothetical protein